MKNIWIINQVAGHPRSGWGERHYYLSEKWIKDGHQVNIMSGSFNHMFNEFPEVKGQFTLEEFSGRRFWWVKCPKYNPKSVLRFWSMMVFAFKVLFLPGRKIGKPDVIIVSSMPIFPILTAYYLKRKYKAKLIFEIRDLWPLTPMHLMGLKKSHPMIWLIGFLEKFGYRKSNSIVSLLPNSGAYIDEISKDPSKLRIIPNGISRELLKDESVPEEIASQIPKDKFIIGYTGTMGMANALEYLTEAMNMLKEDKEIFFVMVGDGYLKDKLMEQTDGNGNVLFVNKIKKDQVQDMIKNFDVCFIGRNNAKLFDYGVSSNKYFDYMLARKPVLVSSNRIKDPVELSGGGIIVEPESATAIVEGVKRLKSMSAEEREAMAQKGYEYVLEKHNFEYLSNEYAKLF